MLYLDNAATSRRKPFLTYSSFFTSTLSDSSNAGRGGHYYSIRAAKRIYETSEALCELFNINSPERIAYTPNATYALNLAILGALTENDHVIITQLEHNSVLRPVHKTCQYSVIPADRTGRLDISSAENMILPNTKMIIAAFASNVCGIINPIKELSDIAHRHGLIFMTDAAQAAGSIPIDVEAMGIDIMAFSGHKGLMTPMGVGGLYVGEGIKIKPVITGGTGSASESLLQPDFMPDMLQSGTLNAPAIIAAKSSVDFILRHSPSAIGEKERDLALRLTEKLQNIPNVTVYAPFIDNRNGTVAFNIKGLDSVRTAQILNDEYKICTRGGWHCAYPTHKALGCEKYGAARASFGFFNKAGDVEVLACAVSKIAKEYSVS